MEKPMGGASFNSDPVRSEVQSCHRASRSLLPNFLFSNSLDTIDPQRVSCSSFKSTPSQRDLAKVGELTVP